MRRGHRHRLRVGQFGIGGEVFCEAGVQAFQFPVFLGQCLTQAGFGVGVPLPWRFADRHDEFGIERLPVLLGILPLPYHPSQGVTAGGETRRHAGHRLRRVAVARQLRHLERFRV